MCAGGFPRAERSCIFRGGCLSRGSCYSASGFFFSCGLMSTEAMAALSRLIFTSLIFVFSFRSIHLFICPPLPHSCLPSFLPYFFPSLFFHPSLSLARESKQVCVRAHCVAVHNRAWERGRREGGTRQPLLWTGRDHGG